MIEQIRIPSGLVILMGPPGSGKSVFAEALVTKGKIEPADVISADDIGEEMFGDQFDPDEKDPLIYAERDRRLRERLDAGRTVFADATNVNPDARSRLIAIAREKGVSVSILRFPLALETLRQQDAAREKHVHDIEKYFRLMKSVTPEKLKEEGADFVIDVPGAEKGPSPQEAAQWFTIAD